jgi:hypothetical protein
MKRRRSATELVNVHLRAQIDVVFSATEVNKLKVRNQSKIHPLSVDARALGGAIQSANIRYGNQLQALVTAVMQQSRKVAVHHLSGRKVQLPTSSAAAAAIERYLSDRDRTSRNLSVSYRHLMAKMKTTKSERGKKVRDVDLLLKPRKGPLILVELKFNDDHDTGKRPDIYRKVLLTADGLRRELRKPVTPMVCYFNSDASSEIRYLPVGQVISGSLLFKRFADVRFSQLVRAINHLGVHFDRKIRPIANGI